MGRIVTTNSVGNQRRQLRRTIAEALRRLMGKQGLDEEGKDLTALIVFSLWHLQEGVEQTAAAWEKRDYYLKADRFRLQWQWVGEIAYDLESALLLGQWERVPELLAYLLPRFADVTIARYTRPPSLWQGCYRRLLHGEK